MLKPILVGGLAILMCGASFAAETAPDKVQFVEGTVEASLTGKTGDIITLSVFGALALYVISMLSLLKLRKSEPELERPYRAPGFPYVPYLALGLAAASFVAVFYYNLKVGLIFLGIVALAFLYFSRRAQQAEAAA